MTVRWAKTHMVISLVLKGILIVLAALTLWRGEYVWSIGVIFAILITFMPAILNRDFNVTVPMVFDISISVAVFLHVVGGYVDFYESIPYYDHITHFISSATISLIGVTFLYVLAFHSRIITLPPAGFGLLTVFFTISMGVFWEFMEWGFDVALGTQLQKGLTDTMWDLLFDTVAGTIVGVISVLQLRRRMPSEVQQLVTVGDIKKSIGYARWREMVHTDQSFKESLKIAFRDPVILKSLVNYVVDESGEIVRIRERVKDKGPTGHEPPAGGNGAAGQK